MAHVYDDILRNLLEARDAGSREILLNDLVDHPSNVRALYAARRAVDHLSTIGLVSWNHKEPDGLFGNPAICLTDKGANLAERDREAREAKARLPKIEEGHYWIQSVEFHDTEPEMGFWDGSHWLFVGSDETGNREDYRIVGDKIWPPI